MQLNDRIQRWLMLTLRSLMWMAAGVFLLNVAAFVVVLVLMVPK